MLRPLLAATVAVLLFAPLVTGQPSAPRGQRDQEIEEGIRERLAKAAIRTENFKFQVRQGVVYWEGSTKVPQRKGAATRLAKAAGARAVVNRIVVLPAAKAAPKAAQQVLSTAPPEAARGDPPAPRRVIVQWRPRR